VFSDKFKAKVALEANWGIKTVNGITQSFGISASILRKWDFGRRICKT